MGVRGLETFLQKQVPNGAFPINILDEIDRMRSEHPDQPVVLVFQVVDLLYTIFLNLSSTEVVCGPDFKKIHKIFDDFLRQLASSADELHFFMNEPAYHKDLKAWSKRESEQYLSRIAIMDKMDSNGFAENKIKKEQGASAALYDLLTICKAYGTVHTSIDSKYIADIAKYSHEKNAMAIVGNNSHFLIFNGSWRYWSCRDIDLMKGNWTTLEFNKNALLEHVGLSWLQMPMFASILGNDFVPPGALYSFHKNIDDSLDGNKPLKLAEYVRLIPNIMTNDEKRDLLLDLFGSWEPRYFEMLRDSLLFYAMKKEATEDEDPLLKLAASIGAVYYNSLKELPIRVKAPTFYDLRRTDVLPYYEIALPILKRQIGFVRNHKNDINYQHVLELRLRHSESIRSMRVTPDYPSVEMPELMELTLNKNGDNYNDVRFALLKWMVFGDDTLPQFEIQHIPKGYMVTVLSVMYLCKLKQLSQLEANAIMLAIHFSDEHEEYTNGFAVPTNITARDVILLHLYIFVHNMMVKCFEFLGLSDFIDFLSIDGVYVVHWMNKMKTDGPDDETLSQIAYLRDFLRFI
ncbi:hypothetical protein HA402_007711 [Bradysia odoriphaga]|nr:hypothetical protein HA402_007711 [Bradysia odoriphaga]